jgi:hypothetical protein
VHETGEPEPIDERLRRASRGAFDLWLDVTRWWTGAVVESAGAWRAENARLLAGTVAEVARGLEGRQVETDYAGRAFRATVETVELDRTPSHGVRLTLGDAVWDDLPIECLSVLAGEVSVQPPPEMALTLSQVNVSGRIGLTELAPWLRRSLPNWGFAVTADNLIEAVGPGGRRRFILDPAIADGKLELVVHEFRWWGLRLPIPRWIRVVRRIALPPVSDGVVLAEATRQGDAIDFKIRLRRICKPLSLRS